MSEIITADRRMKELIQLARTVAQSKATVLIQGEVGTGKGLMARLIHDSSTRAGRPFISISCADSSDALLESELFGSERGGLSGASGPKIGKLELANGGTLLIEGVAELDTRLQGKLLKVIQEGELDRMGGRQSVPVDVRILATTDRNLAERVRQGSFREDLFYRLNVVNITMPPLRDREEDLEALARHFLRAHGQQSGQDAFGISNEAIAVLRAHSWPGNIRELEGVIERSIHTAMGGLVAVKDIIIERRPQQVTASGGEPRAAVMMASADGTPLGWAPGRTLDDVERSVILEALSYHQGNRTHTARALGISIRTLRNKLADYRKLGIHA